MNELVRKGLLIVLFGGVAIIVLVLVLIWATGKSAPNINLLGDGGGQLEKKDGKIVVDRDRVPANFDERAKAAPISLLPNRLPAEPSEAAIPPNDERAIANTVSAFLSRWETFDPSRPDGGLDRYQLGLQKLTAGFALDDIVDRVDSSDPDHVCPYASQGCISGSRWVGAGDIASAMTVADYDGNRAYVTLYGLVTYTGDEQFNSLAGSTFFRSYGLLLTRADGRWLVSRASAETLEESAA